MWDADSRAGFVIVADKLSEQLWNESASADEVESHEADFVLAFEIASAHSTSDVFVNWGMRFYLAKMYLTGTGVAEDGERSMELLRQVAESDDQQYALRARDVLCGDLWLDEFC
jgi:TPR repeat protein